MFYFLNKKMLDIVYFKYNATNYIFYMQFSQMNYKLENK